MNLENTEWKKPDRTSHVVWFHSYEIPRIGQYRETENNLTIARGRGEGNGERLLGGHGAFWSDQKVSNMERGGCTHCKCSNCYWVVHFKVVNCMPCKFHLNKNAYTFTHGINLYNKNKNAVKVFLLQLLPVPFFVRGQSALLHGTCFRKLSQWLLRGSQEAFLHGTVLHLRDSCNGEVL